MEVGSVHKDLIISREQDLLNAMLNSDLQKLDKLIHEDLLFNIPNGQTVTKAMDLETYRSGGMQIREISSGDPEVNLIGDNAVVAVTVEMKGKYFDHVLDGEYRFLRVWKLFNDQWKVIAGSSIRL